MKTYLRWHVVHANAFLLSTPFVNENFRFYSTTLRGIAEQRVFLGWGQVWCESRRPEYERLQAQTNPHSPGRYRVNGVMSNMPEFRRAFSCKPGAPMVRANACRVW